MKFTRRGGRDEIQFEAVWPKRSGIAVRGDAKGVSLSDFNEDGAPDLLVSLNDGDVQAYVNRLSSHRGKLFSVELRGKPGNPTCVGARVTVRFGEDQGPAQTAEIHAGGSYLSQSTPVLTFGCGDAVPARVEVRWPDGTGGGIAVPEGRNKLVLASPR